MGRVGDSFQAYVVGFVFSWNMSRVLLIRKNRPEWQAGKLNGLGGKIEPGETPLQAIVREIHEESGVLIPDSEWIHAITAHFPSAEVHFFYTVCYDDMDDIFRSTTDEEIQIVDVSMLPLLAPNPDGPGEIHPAIYRSTIIPNLNWIIPLCVYHDSGLGGTRIMDIIHIYEDTVPKTENVGYKKGTGDAS